MAREREVWDPECSLKADELVQLATAVFPSRRAGTIVRKAAVLVSGLRQIRTMFEWPESNFSTTTLG